MRSDFPRIFYVRFLKQFPEESSHNPGGNSVRIV